MTLAKGVAGHLNRAKGVTLAGAGFSQPSLVNPERGWVRPRSLQTHDPALPPNAHEKVKLMGFRRVKLMMTYDNLKREFDEKVGDEKWWRSRKWLVRQSVEYHHGLQPAVSPLVPTATAKLAKGVAGHLNRARVLFWQGRDIPLTPEHGWVWPRRFTCTTLRSRQKRGAGLHGIYKTS
jgi:hypothetical protein